MDGKIDIGEKIRALRVFLGYTEKDFGNRIGYGGGHVSRLETGKSPVNRQILDKICETFKVNPAYFTSDLTPEEAVEKEEIDGLDVPSRLKKLREEKGFTQTELSNLSGTAQPVISNVESGKDRLSPKQAEKLATALDVGTEYLLTGKLKYKNYPLNDKLESWLWDHEDVRKRLWEEMKK